MSAVGLKRVRPQPVLIFCCVFVFWVIRLFENTPGGQNGQLGQGRAALPHSHRARTPQKAESGQDLDQRRSLVATFNRWDDLLQQVRLMSAKEQSSACFRAFRDFCLIPFPFSFFFSPFPFHWQWYKPVLEWLRAVLWFILLLTTYYPAWRGKKK